MHEFDIDIRIAFQASKEKKSTSSTGPNLFGLRIQVFPLRSAKVLWQRQLVFFFMSPVANMIFFHPAT